MAYFAPYIDATGFHYPKYQDILDNMVEGAKSIFGEDLYLEDDSADYQLLSIFALQQFDVLQSVAMAYNSRSSDTAVGTGLDSIVKMNGLVRKEAGRSTCDVTLTGTPYAVVMNGSCKDRSGVVWLLPEQVVIPAEGVVTVTATCAVPGPVSAAIGDISQINTPTYGWTSVINTVAATVGVEAETDGELRVRQSYSVAQPSQTMLAGTKSAVAAITDVQRNRAYENDTNSSAVSEDNPHGLDAHCVCCVVEGGDSHEIAEAIFLHKGIGCSTMGDVSVTVEDSSGDSNTIKFYRPTFVPIYVEVEVTAYAGFVTPVLDTIAQKIYDYIAALDIGAVVMPSVLNSIAVSCNENAAKPTFGVASLKIGKTGSTLSTSDIQLTYKEAASIDMDNISVTVAE